MLAAWRGLYFFLRQKSRTSLAAVEALRAGVRMGRKVSDLASAEKDLLRWSVSRGLSNRIERSGPGFTDWFLVGEPLLPITPATAGIRLEPSVHERTAQ